jgi:hypothetical protein
MFLGVHKLKNLYWILNFIKSNFESMVPLKTFYKFKLKKMKKFILFLSAFFLYTNLCYSYSINLYKPSVSSCWPKPYAYNGNYPIPISVEFKISQLFGTELYIYTLWYIQDGVERNIGGDYVYSNQFTTTNAFIQSYHNFCVNKDAIFKIKAYKISDPFSYAEATGYFRVYRDNGECSSLNSVSNGNSIFLETVNTNFVRINPCGIANSTVSTDKYRVEWTINGNFQNHVINIDKNMSYGFKGSSSIDQYRWAHVDNITNNSARLYTFVYYHRSGQYWWPCSPQEAAVVYSVQPASPPVFSHYHQWPNPITPVNSSGYVFMNLPSGSQPINFEWFTSHFQQNGWGANLSNSNPVPIWKYQWSGPFESSQLAPEAKIWATASNAFGSVTGLPEWSAIAYNNPPPACPTITFDMEDGNRVYENTILIQSIDNPGVDIIDNYVMMNPFLQESSDINFSITEPEFSATNLDQVDLMQVEVDWDQFAAVTDDGEIISYRKSENPNRVTMDYREDVTELLAEADGQILNVSRGAHLNIDINSLRGGGRESMSNPYIVMRLHYPVNKESPVGMIYIFDREHKNFYSRGNDNIVCVKLEKGIGNVEITFDQDVSADQIMIVDGEEILRPNYLTMLEAKHNEYGDMMEELSRTDEIYCRILNGHVLSLRFENPSSERKHVYILKSTGSYVEGVFSDSEVKLSNEKDDQVESLPNKLTGNHPNPFNPSTTIKFSLNKEANVKINVYDLSGRLLMQLVNETKPSGEHSVLFDGSTLSSGVYFYRMEVFEGGRSAPSYEETRRMMLIK